MKRYLVFAFPEHYPSGGWGDFVSAHDTLKEARSVATAQSAKSIDFVQIVDLEKMEITE
jgi:hypothetical protein